MGHTDKPETVDELPSEVINQIEALNKSKYPPTIEPLRALIRYKTIMDSKSGHSGFCLILDDECSVIIYLDVDKLQYKHIKGKPSEEDLKLMHNDAYGDGSKPSNENLPYANEECPFEQVIAESKGKQIRGLSVGADCFNICFPQGLELEPWIMTDDDGRKSLRVFWEEW